jgi:hypothetical protein
MVPPQTQEDGQLGKDFFDSVRTDGSNSTGELTTRPLGSAVCCSCSLFFAVIGLPGLRKS